MSQGNIFQTVIFVYNADSGFFSTVTDFAHKILSPQTYACHLCALTYGNFQIKKEWKGYLDNLELKKVFLHKNDFQKHYPDLCRVQLPAIFGIRNEQVETLITAEELNGLNSLEGLKGLLTRRLG